MVENILHISKDDVWTWLGTIPDPDIPVISITELGLVKDVEIMDEGRVMVTITPSYSGCPAMSVFKEDIQSLLKSKGVEEIEIKISHAPAWTTDWLSSAAKEKLKHYGIAPPEESCDTATKLFSESIKKVSCPHCQKRETKLISQFGSTPCKSLWYCNTCQQPFEYFKCY